MNQQIENYITRNYYELEKIAKNITKGHDLYKDLLHNVIIQLYDKTEIKLKDYNDNTIKYFITSCLRLNFHSKTSPFTYKERRERMLYVKLSEELIEMSDNDEPLEKQLLFDILEISFTELSWFNKQVLQCYLELGSLKKVSNEMKIPITTIGKYVLDSKNEIKKNVHKLWKEQ